MPGLLAELDVAFEGGEFTASLDVQVQGLDQIIAAVQGLLDGPPDLGDLRAAIDALPLPPALSGLGQLPGAIGGLVDGFDLGDIEAFLQPILGPLGAIGGEGFDLTGIANLKATICLVQKLLTLVTGDAFTDADGFPLPPGLWTRQRFGVPDDLTADDVRARVQELEANLDRIGPRLDGPKFVDLLRRLGPRWNEMGQWPFIPVLTDVMEIAGVAVRWNAMNGSQLTAELDARLGEIDTLIALPRARVADPFIAQAEAAATLPVALAAFSTSALPVLDRLAAKVRDGAKPTYAEVAALEHEVDALAVAAGALALDDAHPLGRFDDLVPDLELHLLRAVRAMVPPYETSVVTKWVDDALAAIPDPVAEPLADAVSTIAELDLSAITDPLSAVTDAVRSVVDQIRGALADVETALTNALSPLADGMDSLLSGAGLDDLQGELANLPATLQTFIDDQVEPVVEPIRDAVSSAVQAVDEAADQFDPESLIAPLRDAITNVAGLLETDEVASVVGEVRQAMEAATEAIASLDFAAAADSAIALIEELEAKLAEIDPISLPQPALEVAEQAVSVVADIDFTAEVAEPLVASAGGALAAGPGEVLDALQAGVDALRRSLERFRPSVAVGGVLDQPFAAMLVELDRFEPSELLDSIHDALRDAVAKVNVIDPSVVIAPLTEVHARLAAAVDSIRPSTLLAPVDAAIAAGIARLFEVTGIDDVFDGIDDVMASLTDWVTLVAETRSVLQRMADLLSDPGDIAGALDELVRAIVDRLDLADLDALRPRFDALAATVRSVERDQLAPRLTRSLRAAQGAVPAALAGPDARRVLDVARAFPLAQLRTTRSVPVRDRLVTAMERLLGLCDVMATATTEWTGLSAAIDRRAPRLEAELLTYSRLTIIDGKSVFADCIIPRATRAELKASVEKAVRDGLELPVTVFFGLFAKLAPLVGSVAAGLADVVGAIHAKLDVVTGDTGVGGVVGSIEEAADLLRNLDLSPLTGPLDALHGRLETAVAAVEPAPLGAALQAAADAVAGLLDLSTLLDPALIAQLDATYAAAVTKLRALRPSEVVAETLDPVYEDLLADVLPLLDLPALLRELLATARATLEADITAQLARVEVAFDDMLRALPFGPMSGSVSVEVDASVGGGGS